MCVRSSTGRWVRWCVPPVVVCAALAVLGVVAGPASAAGPVGCGYASAAATGKDASTLCWIDLTSFNQAQALSAGGEPFTITLPGGYTMKFNLTKRITGTLTFNGVSAFDNQLNVSYPGVPGKSRVATGGPGGLTGAFTLNNIQMTDSAGQPVSDWNMIGADAEETASVESITFKSTGPITELAALQLAGNDPGCQNIVTGLGTNTVTCTASAAKTGGDYGSAVFETTAPTSFEGDLHEGATPAGVEAVAFAVQVAKVTLKKTVTARDNPNDSFDLAVTSPEGTQVGTATTGATNSASTGALTVMPRNALSYTLAETATPASGSVLSDYTHAWACTNALAGSATVLPSGSGTSQPLSPQPGDDITCTITNAPILAAVSIEKHALVTPVADQSGAQVGDTITYTYDVTNTGKTTLKSAAVSDPSIGTVACNNIGPAGLAPGATTTCQANTTHVVTQADVDAGSVKDTATATGTDEGGQVSPVSAPDSATVEMVTPNPSLSITKTPNASLGDQTPVKVGETIGYSYVATNTGNATMTNVGVTDTTAGHVTCDTTTLAPNASTKCTADNTYVVSQADVDGGGVFDTATASGVDPSGTTDKSQPVMKHVPSSPGPAVSVTKTPSVTPIADKSAVKVGDTIAYAYTVTNIGNVTLKSVSLTDSDASIGQITCQPLPAGGLPPGGTVPCSAPVSHTVTQTDVDAGSVDNTAYGTGTDPQGDVSPQSDPATASVPAVAPVVTDSIHKTGTVTPNGDQGAAQVGDTIAYSYDVTNTGNVTVKKVDVSDPTIGSVTCNPLPAGGLPPNGVVHCTADSTHVVTQADVDAGSIVDSATATGTGIDGVIGPPSQKDKFTVTTEAPAPTVTLTKIPSVAPAGDEGAVKVGDLIFYTYQVKNTGNVTLASVDVSDPAIGTVNCQPPAAPGLAPNAVATCTAPAPHVVTQADVDAGSVDDTASATGTDAQGNVSPSVNGSASENAAAPSPSITVRKLPNALSGNQTTLVQGQTITYTYLLKNTGNVTLTNVGVSDSTGSLNPSTCDATTLAPDDTTNCAAAAPYTVTTTDATNNDVSDTATASGTPPTGATVHATDTAHVPATAAAGVSITKTATVSPSADQSDIQVGDTVQDTYVVTNTGNVTLTTVSVADSSGVHVTCDPIGAGLVPGGTDACSADTAYTVQQSDVDAGKLVDTGTATGAVANLSAQGTDSKTLFSAPAPLVLVNKVATVTPAGDQDAVQVGDTIAYSYTVTNTGNVTLASVAVNDPTIGNVTCQPLGAGGLAPGDSDPCTADSDHTVTQADVDAGTVVDHAKAHGTDTLGNVSPDGSDTATVDAVPPAPDVSVAKHGTVSPASDTGALKVGDTVAYSYVAKNTGNTTLKSVSVTDPTFAQVNCPTPASPGLAPNATETCNAVGTYTVNQADVDAGGVSDRASITGTDVNNNTTPTGTGTDTETSTPTPNVSVLKTATVNPAADQPKARLGDAISYSYKVTNTGNVDLRSVSVTDQTLGPVSCPIPAAPGLPPGQSETCTGELQHTVDAGDITAGKVTDTATGTGTTIDGKVSPTSAPSTVTVTAGAPVSKLQITKTVNHAVAYPGQTLTYTLTVTNKGPDPASDTTVSDTPSMAMTILSIHSGSGSCTKGSTITCSLGTLKVGGKVKITVTARVLKAGTERNTASVKSDSENPDPKGAVDAASARISPILIVHKTASRRHARPGQNITYRITAADPTAVAISHVSVCDALPGGLVFVHASPKGHLSNGKHCWMLASLGAHTSKRLSIVANAAPGKGGNVTNHATATAPGARSGRSSATVNVAPAQPIPCGTASRSTARHSKPKARVAC